MQGRVMRGGSWCNLPWNCRSAYRRWLGPDYRNNNIGFRIVCEGSEMQMIEQLGNDATLEMVQIPGGTFLMGSSDSESGRYRDEGPQHEVTVPTFAMGKYPVTQAQWQAVMGNNPSYFKGANLPVECVSWNDAVEFCERLSRQSGKHYRLPTESEWEYACRAGTTTPYFFGKSLGRDKANYYSESTSEVGYFSPNDFGLYDMHGNIWEWCLDRWHNNYSGAPVDGSAWTTEEYTDRRVIRGGSWGNYPWYCRSAYRSNFFPNYCNNNVGFRVVCETRSTTMGFVLY